MVLPSDIERLFIDRTDPRNLQQMLDAAKQMLESDPENKGLQYLALARMNYLQALGVVKMRADRDTAFKVCVYLFRLSSHPDWSIPRGVLERSRTLNRQLINNKKLRQNLLVKALQECSGIIFPILVSTDSVLHEGVVALVCAEYIFQILTNYIDIA